MTRYKPVAALLCAVVVAACEKNAVQDITMPTIPSAQIRFFNFGVNAPSVNFYANTTKMTATSSSVCSPTPTDTVQQRLCRENGSEATTGVAYGSVGALGLYSAIEPGAYTFTGTIAATTDKNLAVATVTTTLAANKEYSVYVSGFYNTTAKTVEAFIVEDPIPAIDYANSPIRFVNAISNSTPQILYAKNTTTGVETAIGGTVAYKEAGAFATLAPGLYDLNTRAPGSSTNVITRTGVTLSPGRIYTISARGDFTIASTGTATNRAFLDNTANR